MVEEEERVCVPRRNMAGAIEREVADDEEDEVAGEGVVDHLMRAGSGSLHPGVVGLNVVQVDVCEAVHGGHSEESRPACRLSPAPA